MLDRMSALEVPTASEVATIEQVRAARRVVGSIYIDDRVRDYIVHIVQATRKPRDYGLGELAPLIEYGASPRATLCLAAAARAHAFIRHRAYVTPDDIKAIALDVLRHRVVVTYEAEAEEVSSEDVVRRDLRVPAGARRRHGAMALTTAELFKKARKIEIAVAPARRRAARRPVPLGVQGPRPGLLRRAPVLRRATTSARSTGTSRRG